MLGEAERMKKDRAGSEDCASYFDKQKNVPLVRGGERAGLGKGQWFQFRRNSGRPEKPSKETGPSPPWKNIKERRGGIHEHAWRRKEFVPQRGIRKKGGFKPITQERDGSHCPECGFSKDQRAEEYHGRRRGAGGEEKARSDP